MRNQDTAALLEKLTQDAKLDKQTILNQSMLLNVADKKIKDLGKKVKMGDNNLVENLKKLLNSRNMKDKDLVAIKNLT